MPKRRQDLSHIPIEIMPYDGSVNPSNPFDRLTPEERYQKIAELWAKLYLRVLDKRRKASQAKAAQT